MYQFLSQNEEIKYELKTETGLYLVTDTRFIFTKELARKQGQIFDDYYLKYVAHAHVISKEGRDDRLIGAILAIIGVLAIALGYIFPEYGYSPYVIGFLLLVPELLLFFSHAKPISTLTIEIIGLQTKYTYEIDAPGPRVIELLSIIAEQRQTVIETEASQERDELNHFKSL